LTIAIKEWNEFESAYYKARVNGNPLRFKSIWCCEEQVRHSQKPLDSSIASVAHNADVYKWIYKIIGH